jgi:hypothetical protein
VVADPVFEQRLRRELRAHLDGAVGPDPTWAESPAARRIDAGTADAGPTRRHVHRSTLLFAASLSALTLAGILVAGGALRQRTENPPSVLPATVPSAPAPSVAPSAAVAVSDPSTSPSARPSAAPCQTSWTHTGTRSPVGLVDGIRVVEFDGTGGELAMAFPHGIETVHRILIEPAEPPFRTTNRAQVKVAGSVFYQLTIDGLTKPTAVDDRMVAGKGSAPYLNMVSLPIAEMRRLWKPVYRSPNVGPGRNSTEVWAIGLAGPPCIRVRTVRDPSLGDDPGDNVLIIDFDSHPVLIPEPIPLLIPTPSPAAGTNPSIAP